MRTAWCLERSLAIIKNGATDPTRGVFNLISTLRIEGHADHPQCRHFSANNWMQILMDGVCTEWQQAYIQYRWPANGCGDGWVILWLINRPCLFDWLTKVMLSAFYPRTECRTDDMRFDTYTSSMSYHTTQYPIEVSSSFIDFRYSIHRSGSTFYNTRPQLPLLLLLLLLVPLMDGSDGCSLKVAR